MVGVMFENRGDGREDGFVVLYHAGAEAAYLHLALREGVECVDGLVGRDALREMDDDFGVL